MNIRVFVKLRHWKLFPRLPFFGAQSNDQRCGWWSVFFVFYFLLIIIQGTRALEKDQSWATELEKLKAGEVQGSLGMLLDCNGSMEAR